VAQQVYYAVLFCPFFGWPGGESVTPVGSTTQMKDVWAHLRHSVRREIQSVLLAPVRGVAKTGKHSSHSIIHYPTLNKHFIATKYGGSEY
jgi:hypothetical protein